ncbi:MAG: hypothetical protein FWE27_08955 [Defluviitaleaceae bacterium]|nr:hypothetical protein [Defluviitaleaceae bacterium]
MELLKHLFYDFISSGDDEKLGKIPEIAIAFGKLNDWAKSLDEDGYNDFEELVSGHGTTCKLQGFIYGFRYGVQLMAECFPKNTTASDY